MEKNLFFFVSFYRNIDPCKANKPCKNGATCVNSSGDYRCICKTGYQGRNCEQGDNIIIRSLIDILTMLSFMLDVVLNTIISYYLFCFFSGNKLVVQYSTIKMWFHGIAMKTNFEY